MSAPTPVEHARAHRDEFETRGELLAHLIDAHGIDREKIPTDPTWTRLHARHGSPHTHGWESNEQRQRFLHGRPTAR